MNRLRELPFEVLAKLCQWQRRYDERHRKPTPSREEQQ